MKACVIQPPYSRNVSDCDEFFEYKMDMLNSCDDTVDIIVLPEYSDVPCATSTLEETLYYHNKYIDRLLEKCIETAKRCNSLVFVNALSKEEKGYRNTTYCYNRSGELVGKYFKKHLPPLELEVLKLDSDYTFCPSEPYVIEIEGLRYGFLTCYDFYFYESFARIARENVDVIIGCSLQRSDSHDAIEIMCKFLAYNTNAYVIRSSVSFSEDSDICGASMVVNPKGEVLENMKGKFGKAVVEFDPKDKYYKPAGYGNPPSSHYEYIEYGRKPWQYRNGGASVVMSEHDMPYPRICAHRGFNTVAPENSMPAFGAAVAMGAEEIEFDLWYTKDGELVSLHDPTLDRVSDGHGKIYEHTFDELIGLDFGGKFSEAYKGLPVLKFEEVLQKFAGHVIMNIHIKNITADAPYDPELMKKIITLIDKYDCRKHVYFMSENDNILRLGQELAPDIVRVVGFDGDPNNMVDRALKYDCKKIQLFKPYFDQALVDRAHENGILCNVFWSDDLEEAKKFLDMGIDVILSNDYNRVAQAVNEWKKEHRE